MWMMVLLLLALATSAPPAQAPKAGAAPRPQPKPATFVNVPWGTPHDEALEMLRHAGYVEAVKLKPDLSGLAGSVYGRSAELAVSFNGGLLTDIAIVWSVSDERPDVGEAFKAKLKSELSRRLGKPKSSSAPEAAVQDYEWPAARVKLQFLDTSIILAYSGISLHDK